MIGVTVKLPVNIRKGPGTNFGIMGVASPSGRIMMMDGYEEGENYKGFNKWYYKLNDNQEKQFYWGGRLSLSDTQTATDPIAPPAVTIKSDFRNYINSFNLPWLSSEGKNITIAVIDTGVSTIGNDFNNAAIEKIDFSANRSANNDHGTFITGILAGIGGQVRGIAPQSKILSLRMSDTVTGKQDQLENCNKAFSEVIKRKKNTPNTPIVINLSQGFNDSYVTSFPDQIKTMSDLIKELDILGVPIFCAAGEDELLEEGNLVFPADMQETIAVGCITQTTIGSTFSHKINIITPLQQYQSFNTTHSIVVNSGSSFSTAFITSLAATFYSDQGIFSKTAFFAALNSNKSSIANFKFNTPTYQYSF